MLGIPRQQGFVLSGFVDFFACLFEDILPGTTLHSVEHLSFMSLRLDASDVAFNGFFWPTLVGRTTATATRMAIRSNNSYNKS